MQTRQQAILELLVKEYIRTAEPVGSQFLAENYKLEISPATVRNEMVELTEAGYLTQPHTSAGRVPTDKGYRFFVDRIEGGNELNEKEYNKLRNAIKDIRNFQKEYHKFVKEISRMVSHMSQNVGIFGFLEQDDFYTAGLANLFKEPEFMGIEDAFGFLENFDSLDKEFEKIFNQMEGEVRVFIGRENIIDDFDDMSLVVSRCRARRGKKGVVGILGPRRMNYAKNIALVDAIRDLINTF